jgi:hypothetical protein
METRKFSSTASGAFVIEGELPDGSMAEIKCAGATTVGENEISGGKPGIGRLVMFLETCTLEKPEKANCSLAAGTIRFEAGEFEIVENEANGKVLLALKPTSSTTGNVGRFTVQGVGCKHRACPNMEGTALAEVSKENGVAEELVIKISSTPTKYVKQSGEKKNSNFEIAGKAAKINGEVTIKLKNANEPFGPFVK